MEEQTPKGLRRYLSSVYLRKKVGIACNRFPLAAFFAVFTSVLILINIIAEPITPTIDYLILSSSLGYFLSVAAVMWSEFMNKKSLWPQLAAAVVSALMFEVWELNGKNPADSLFVGTAAVFTAVAAMLFFVPCFKKPTLKLSHSYTNSVIGNAVISMAVSWAMAIFIIVLWETVALLFGIKSYKAFQILMVLFSALLPMTVFLCRMPMVNDENDVPGFTAPVVRNILLIPALIYMAVLYVYGFKILVEWELPKAPIVWMVTGIVAVVLLIIFGLQGYMADKRSKEINMKIARLALRFLPVALLPLLVLMSVAIFYRIGQYGITSPRLYVATFNIWAYAAVVYLIFSRRAELSNLAATFAVIFLAVSVIPGFNYCSVDKPLQGNSGDEEIVEVVGPDCFAEAAGPLKIADIPQAFNTIEYRSKTDYRTSKPGALRDIELEKGIVVSVPLDSLAALPDSTFTPCILPVDNYDDKAFMLTEYSIWANYIDDVEKIGEFDNVTIKGYLLSK